jgi:hypothetical protein
VNLAALLFLLASGEFLPVSLDSEGPYLILSSPGAAREYGEAREVVRALHPGATEATVDLESEEAIAAVLREAKPRFAFVLALPGEIDVNLAWRWLRASSAVDADPLPDVRTGFLTGATPAAAAAFARRIAAAARGEAKLPRRFVDDLGPNEMAPPEAFFEEPRTWFFTALPAGFPCATISHGKAGFTDARLGALDGAGLVHFGGHGYPDRIVDGVIGRQAGRLALAPCVVWNGACYTGATDRWFDEWGGAGKVVEKRVAPEENFCLNLLANSVVGYLAALHPDHGIPVYQEMEHLVATGAPLGELMRQTGVAVVLGAGGRLPPLAPLADGAPSKALTPTEVMLRGTASRVLFGDPALAAGGRLVGPALKVETGAHADGGRLVTVTVANPAMRSTLTDTFHADLSADGMLFNDRALVAVDLPADHPAVQSVEILSAEVGGKALRHRLVSWVVEEDLGARRLLIQVDFAATAFMQGPFRTSGATLTLALCGSR